MRKSKFRKAPKEALAIHALLQAQEEGKILTVQELADHAGCHKGSIGRMPNLTKFRNFLLSQAKADLPRGSRDRDRKHENLTLEAWDEDARIPGKITDDELE